MLGKDITPSTVVSCDENNPASLVANSKPFIQVQEENPSPVSNRHRCLSDNSKTFGVRENGGNGVSGSKLVRLPNVIVMVGLPARGKSYISSKLCRYLNWIGVRTKVFNVGDYRRSVAMNPNFEFFNANNMEAHRVRMECAQMALDDLCRYLDANEGEVGIFDATNSSRERRSRLLECCKRQHFYRVLFVESICEDPQVVESNIQDVKLNSPDYFGMDKEMAREDFIKRIDQYRAQYDPMDEVIDGALSYIQVFNAGRSFFVNNIQGHVQSRVVYFLMNIHLMPRTIFFTRHGESEMNILGRIGGDSPLSEQGVAYSVELEKYFQKENMTDLRIWTSRKIRTVQTAQKLSKMSQFVEHWKALDEIDAGICEGLTYEEIQERYPEQFAARDKDKYHYRYPSGESYEDLVARLEPVIMELERQKNVLVVGHQAVLRCLLAYFLDKTHEQLPYVRVPLHSVLKLTPVAYGCRLDEIKFHIDAVDTHRVKPASVMAKRSASEALSTVPPSHRISKELVAGVLDPEVQSSKEDVIDTEISSNKVALEHSLSSGGAHLAW